MGSKAREGAKATSLGFVLDFQHAGQKKSIVYEMECRHAAVQRGKQDQIFYNLKFLFPKL